MKTNKKCVIGLLAATFALSLGFGVATVNTAMAEETTATFEMITGASVRADDPAGIRFTTVVNDAYKATLSSDYDYVWGTKLTFTPVNGESSTLDVDTLVWTDDTQTKWHTALLNVPTTDYLTEITAESYVKGYAKDNTEKTTVAFSATVGNPQTRSLAWAASWALNDGYTQSILSEYVSTIETAVTMSKTSLTMYVDDTYTLTATTEEGYGVVWTSSNEEVATVDKTGKVTAVGEGTAEITASVGGNQATCTVSVILEPVIADNVAVSFTADSDLEHVSVYWPTVHSIAFDTTTQHGDDAGSLKVVAASGNHDNYIILSNPFNKNFSEYDYISFWVYNAGKADFKMGTTWTADTTCKVGEWTEVVFTAEMFAASKIKDMNNTVLTMSDITALPLRIFGTESLTTNDCFYISSIAAGKNEVVEEDLAKNVAVKFDKDSDLNCVSVYWPTAHNIAIDTTTKHGNDAGSLKVTLLSNSDNYIILSTPYNTDFSAYDYISFWVYNSGSADFKMGTTWAADTTCVAGQWTEVVITKEMFEASKVKDMNNNVITMDDITKLPLRIFNTSGLAAGESFYVSSVVGVNEVA